MTRNWKIALVGLMSLLLASLLVACGGSSNLASPAIPNATPTELPPAFKSQLEGLAGSSPNTSLQAFKSKETANQLESVVNQIYGAAGWENKSNEMGTEDMQSLGVFISIYRKNDSASVVMIYPGSIAAMMGAKAVGTNETLILVANGTGIGKPNRKR